MHITGERAMPTKVVLPANGGAPGPCSLLCTLLQNSPSEVTAKRRPESLIPRRSRRTLAARK